MTKLLTRIGTKSCAGKGRCIPKNSTNPLFHRLFFPPRSGSTCGQPAVSDGISVGIWRSSAKGSSSSPSTKMGNDYDDANGTGLMLERSSGSAPISARSDSLSYPTLAHYCPLGTVPT
jgi:hypothetical protein